ncbi:MAG: precorrin-8X methylmutase [Phycisphaerae bacterium]|nr:precorrin-8X methylmutase [Phycisphaerae bacterium]
MTTQEQTRDVGILIVGHGSPRSQANEGFLSLVARVADRLGVTALPTFFSIAKPSIEDQVALLASQGIRRIVLMPYFLYSGQHIKRDIPELLEKCRHAFPGVTLELLPTLEGELALEDLLVDRLTPLVPSQPLPADGAAIERRSHEIIEHQLQGRESADPAERAVVRRVVHATADLSFARSLRIHPRAIAAGRKAIVDRKPVICDVKMLVAGLTHVPGEVLCAIGDPDVAQAAKGANCTRAAAAIDALADRLAGAIVAVGNAPTALWRVMEIARSGGPRPALVVGLPVGFVGARESKDALMQSDLIYISNVGARGGSPVAAAVVNALAFLTQERGA